MSLLEDVNGMLGDQAGVYTSDKAGHLLDLRFNPLRVICVTCMETADRSQSKFHHEFEKVAVEFTKEHGYLGTKIANNVEEIIEFYLANKVTRWKDEQGREYAQDARGNTVCITEVFPVSQELIEDLEKNGF